MSSGSSQQPVTQTQTSDPWSGAQPHLLSAMNSAQSLSGNNIGYQPWTGQTQADPNQYFNQAGVAPTALPSRRMPPAARPAFSTRSRSPTR